MGIYLMLILLFRLMNLPLYMCVLFYHDCNDFLEFLPQCLYLFEMVKSWNYIWLFWFSQLKGILMHMHFFFSRRLFKYFDKILSECEHRFIATLDVMLNKYKNIYQHDSHCKKKKKKTQHESLVFNNVMLTVLTILTCNMNLQFSTMLC